MSAYERDSEWFDLSLSLALQEIDPMAFCESMHSQCLSLVLAAIDDGNIEKVQGFKYFCDAWLDLGTFVEMLLDEIPF